MGDYAPYVTCLMLRVKSIFFFFLNPTQKIGQCGGASWWRVCCQRGLPRLDVILVNDAIFFYGKGH